MSDDRFTCTFSLREGVELHDGSDFDAADVVTSLNAARREDSRNPDKARLAGVIEVASPEPGKVAIKLSRPYMNILDALSSNAGLVTAQGLFVEQAVTQDLLVNPQDPAAIELLDALPTLPDVS